MKLYILNCGYLMGDLGWLVSMYNPAVINNTNPDRIWQKIPLTCFLIDHPKVGWILYDTGPSLRATEKSYWTKNETRKNISANFPLLSTEDELLPAQLAKLQLKPEDIGTLVVSHLHWDHAGNVDLFPGAKIYVHKADFTNALVSVYQTPERDHEFYTGDNFILPEVTWTLIDEDTEIAEGVELITLAGHTPGVLGMVAHLEKFGTVICPSDAIYTPTNLGPPPHPPGIIYDTVAFRESAEKVLSLKDKYNANVFYTHHKESYSEYKLVPDYYD